MESQIALRIAASNERMADSLEKIVELILLTIEENKEDNAA